MFEFHGWVTVRVDDRDDPDMDVKRGREQDAIDKVRSAIRIADDNFSFFDLRRTSNELIVLSAHGLRNHRYEPVIELFRWLARELPNSYGLLYVYDDEDRKHDNEFRVWQVARGRFDEASDTLLSPYVPTVEPPWE